MTEQHGPIRAVALISGGLDSLLAARAILDQGIQVTGLHFCTGFSYAACGAPPEPPPSVARIGQTLGIPVLAVDVSSEFIPLVLAPRHGYGAHMNPCIDCRIFNLRRAGAWMREHHHHFVVTGEVLGQRPMSQHRPALDLVERQSGLQGYLLRPLSAQLLPPTIPEQQGWVDRERLYAMHGRSRKPQIALAAKLGIEDYEQPSGGNCYLLDAHYSRRLRDLLAHEGAAALTPGMVRLLAVGRHMRLPGGQKLIVGRNEEENRYLAAWSGGGTWLTTPDVPGPTSLLLGDLDPGAVDLAARITAAYSDAWQAAQLTVRLWTVHSTEERDVEPLPRPDARSMLL